MPLYTLLPFGTQEKPTSININTDLKSAPATEKLQDPSSRHTLLSACAVSRLQ